MPSTIRTGFVYFVQCPANGLIKIGITDSHPDGRLRSLRIGSPVPLEALGIMRGTLKLERMLHLRFHVWRSHGEWFSPAEELMEFIARNAKPWPKPDPRRPSAPVDPRDELYESQIEKLAEWAFFERRRQCTWAMNRMEAGEIMGLA